MVCVCVCVYCSLSLPPLLEVCVCVYCSLSLPPLLEVCVCLLFSLSPSIGHLLATTRLVSLPYCDHTLQRLLSLCVLHYLYRVLLREEQSDLQEIVAAVILGEDPSGFTQESTNLHSG